MKQLICLLIILSSFNSCVTILNKKRMVVHVKSSLGARLVYNKEYLGMKTRQGIKAAADGEEIKIPDGGIDLLVKRDRRKILPVTVRKDSVEKAVQVKPVISGAFIANVWHVFPLLSFGFLVDMKNPNRFGYPRSVYVDFRNPDDNGHFYQRPLKRMVLPHKRPFIDIDITPPLGNIYTYSLENVAPSAGILGSSLALNYHYGAKDFLTLEGSVNAFLGVWGEKILGPGDTNFHQKKSGWAVSIKHNHVVKRMEFGYGLSLWSHVSNNYYEIIPDPERYTTHYRRDMGIGLSASAYYFVKDFFALGLSYQPQVLSLSGTPRFNYEYALTIGMKFRLHAFAPK